MKKLSIAFFIFLSLSSFLSADILMTYSGRNYCIKDDVLWGSYNERYFYAIYSTDTDYTRFTVSNLDSLDYNYFYDVNANECIKLTNTQLEATFLGLMIVGILIWSLL